MKTLIYGAGYAGVRLSIFIKNFEGFIDDFKKGTILDKPIYSLQEVSKNTLVLIPKRFQYLEKVLNRVNQTKLNYRIIDEPIKFNINLTNICNAKCIFCPYTYSKHEKALLTELDFQKGLELAKYLGYSIIDFTPVVGDIFIHPKWDYFLKKAINTNWIKYILFYSNLILLNKQNLEKLKPFLESGKIPILEFSLGGLDRNTYKFMFGVDKFNTVKNNLQDLVKYLYKTNLKIPIVLHLRFPKNYAPSRETILKTLNITLYKDYIIFARGKFENFGKKIKYQELEYLEKSQSKQKPCYRLQNVSLEADGSLFLCDCIGRYNIEFDKTKSGLYIGHISMDKEEVKNNIFKIFQAWKKNIIPPACKQCNLYDSI
jgi:hypothetical protein